MSISGPGAHLQQTLQYQSFLAAKQRRQDDVIRHEHAHSAAAGALGGHIEYDYDDMGYIVGGKTHVTIPGLNRDNPKETMHHAQTLMSAASAPGHDMSGQDAAVYGMASKLYFQAQQLLNQKAKGV